MAQKKTLALFLLTCFLSASMFTFSPVKADSTNLAPYPDAFLSWGNTGYITQGTFYGQTCTRVEYNPAYCAAIYGTFHGGAMSELNNEWWPISPGDRLVLSATMKADASTIGDNFYGIQGIRIGLDMYGGGGRICEIDSLDGLNGWTGAAGNPVIPGYYDPTVTGGNGWTTVTYDFIVPDTYLTDPNHGAGYTTNQWAEPTGFICWISTDGATDERAYGYFYNTVLQVNPEGPTPSPSPVPTATPIGATPTPTPTPTPAPTPTPTIAHPNNPPITSPTPVPTVITNAQAATNQVFINMYVALGILVMSTLIAGAYIIITSLNNGGENLRLGVGILLTSFVELTIGVVVVNAFQGSMGTVEIILIGVLLNG